MSQAGASIAQLAEPTGEHGAENRPQGTGYDRPVSAPSADAERPWGTVYFSPYGPMYIGGGISNDLHRHYTASVSFSLEGDFRVRIEGIDDWLSFRGLLVAPNVEQQMDALSARMVILQIDPETEAYDQIAHWFGAGPVQRISDELVEELAREAGAVLARTPFDAYDCWTHIISRLSNPGFVRRRIDPRIAQAIAILKRDILTPPSAAELARAVGLSEGRLIHLFTREMGLPMRRYLLWLRLRRVVFALAEGATMTEAAHVAGYADSAHMSRTFREMFGLPPSLFLKTSRTINLEFFLPPGERLPDDPVERELWARVRTKLAES